MVAEEAALMDLPFGVLGSALESTGSSVYLNFTVNEDTSLLAGGKLVIDNNIFVDAIAVDGAPTAEENFSLVEFALGS